MKAKVESNVVSNPEYLCEGAAIEDFMKSEWEEVGTIIEKATKVMEN